MDMLNLVIFGPPGAGKGTHSVKLVEKYDLIHISTGDLFRKEIANNTPLGKKTKEIIDKGSLMPDEIVLEMLFSTIDNHPYAKGFIFDGFPRTINQAEKFDEMLSQRNAPVSIVVSLEVDNEELIHRLVKRGIEAGRADDTEEVIRQRLEVYNDQTKPLLDYYHKKDILHSIYGIGRIDDIFANICRVIESNVEI